MIPASRCSPRLLALLAASFTLLAGSAHADPTLNNIATYAGGEFDAGATHGGAVTTAVDNTSSAHLYTLNGTVTWSNNTAAGSGSSFAYNFDGNSSLISGGTISTDQTNVGLEAWVKLNVVPSGYGVVMINGLGADGFGFGVINGNWSGLVGGVAWLQGDTPVAATTGTWTELAMVLTSSSATFYVNGAAIASTGDFVHYGYLDNPDDYEYPLLRLGSDSTENGRINGSVDNARLFTFAEDAFHPSALNLVPTAVPEPSTYALLAGLAVLSVVFATRRRPT